jgi:hypothetical protein
MLTIPDSWGVEALQEFNPYHDPKDGRFTSKSGAAGGHGGSAPESKPGGGAARPTPTRVTSIEQAINLILKGEVVELDDAGKVHTVLSKLAEIAADAVAKGEKAPTYDLCQVSVPGTNLFCSDNVGIKRIDMPQLGGEPKPGSMAARLPKDDKGEVNASDAFVDYLNNVMKIGTKTENVPAAVLRASQSELVGTKVAGMMTAKTYNPAGKPIFVSRDNYVVDGHHRWAATVGRDAADGNLGDLTMKVIKIDAPISEVLKLANSWTRTFGIKPKAAGKAAK